MDGAQQRASDDDRRWVVHALERHTAAGRLNLDEYAERVDRALAARTHGELAQVTTDLPAEPLPDPEAAAAQSRAGQLGIAFVLAFLALIVVAGLVALR
ncbi:MAG TPA: DUF1707 domain-containing protein [Rugosimonospora sp.]